MPSNPPRNYLAELVQKLEPEPGWTYGQVLPMREQVKDGQVTDQWALPGFVREPLQDLLRLAQRPTQPPTEKIPANELMNLTGLGMGAGTLAPRGAAGMFAGLRAKLSPEAWKGFDDAQKMLYAGVHPDEIWQKTGWSNNFADGRWRYEIPDNKAFLLRSGPGGRPVTDYLEHTELFKAYPHLREMPVEHIGNDTMASAYYVPLEGKFGMDFSMGGGEKRTNLLHELQHAVDHYEGRTSGTSPEAFLPQNFQKTVDKTMATYANQMQTVREEAKKLAEKHGVPFEPLVRAISGHNDAFDQMPAEKLFDVARDIAHLPILTDLAETQGKLQIMGNMQNAAIGAYRKNLGEVMARTTEVRSRTPAQGLRQVPPWKMYDTPQSDHTVSPFEAPK